MKKLLIAALSLCLASVALAEDVKVDAYTKKDGTRVEEHHRTKPNGTKVDNYSTKGNTNPYTGKEGKKDPYK